MSNTRSPLQRVRALPTSVWLGLVLLVALLVRIALQFRAPLFVTGDSEGYLVPAYALAHGQELDLSIKRTPAYPAFVALSLALQGDDLQSLALLQHLLGLVTVAATFWLGRNLFGTTVGILGGLLVGLSGTQLIAEHSLMTEALFIPLLVLALACSVASVRGGSYRLSLLAGVLLGMAILVRPVALALVPILAFGPIVQLGLNRRAFTAGGLVILAAGVMFGAWTLRPGKTDDAAVGGLGQTLIGRTARHDRGAFSYWDPALHSTEPPERQQIRRILQDAADRGSSGRAVHTRIRKETGLSAADADAAMRDLALESIRGQLDYYIQGTVQRFVRLAQPSTERLRDARNTNDVARQRWEDEPTRPLLEQATTTYDREAGAAEALTGIAQLGQLGAWLPALAILGAVVAVRVGLPGPALVLAGSVVILLALSAALVGNVPRYRYPVDPIMVMFAVGGIVSLGRSVRRAVVRPRRGEMSAARRGTAAELST